MDGLPPAPPAPPEPPPAVRQSARPGALEPDAVGSDAAATPGLLRRDVLRAGTALQLLSCVPGGLDRTMAMAREPAGETRGRVTEAAVDSARLG